MTDSARPQPIAVVGMSARVPGARTLDAYWRLVRDGVEALETFGDADLDAARVDPAMRADPRYVRKGSPLEGADELDAAFFGFSPREAEVLDPQQRVFLECAWEALEHAGAIASAAGQSVAVFAGAGMNSYLLTQLLANPRFLAAVGGYQVMVGSDKDFLATRVAYKLDLRGPAVTVQTACSTSLVAVAMACRALQRGECDLALAGGVSIAFPQRGGYLYEEGMIFSPDGHCRPFDAQARGTRGGSGAAAVVLKRLDEALADRDTIHGVLLGAAVNNDGAAKAGYTAPSVDGQVEVIATAQALAGVEARSIGLVEAHGTATPLGDPIEIAALTKAFRASTADVGFCRLGSVKANVGHLDAAAGVAGLVKAILALEHRELPPLVNFRSPNPQLALESSPFVASAAAAPWAAGATPRRAGVSSFGIGGTNAHVVVEEAPAPPPPAPPARDAHVLVLSAKTPAALDRATADLAAHLRAHPEARLADVEWTLATGRRAFQHRRAVVVRDATQAGAALSDPRSPAVLAGASDAQSRPVAFLFSGQGSQHAGMGSSLYRTEPAYREAIDRCAELLRPHLDVDLREVLFGAASARIDETRYTQPALFATEYALATLWTSWGVAPAAMLGHSIGEYVAAHLAGVLSLEDALALVATRGRLMQSMAPGRMAAIHLAGAELDAFVAACPGVEVAARNAPRLCTVAGAPDAIAALLARAEANGVDARALHTSHAFHSAMMEPALDAFLAAVERVALSGPTIPYVSNVTGTWITAAQATSPAYYAEHLRRAVRFDDGVRALTADPAPLLLEVGPGNALASLARLGAGKDGAKRVVASLAHPREQRDDVVSVLEAVARLWLAGARLDWSAMHRRGEPRHVPLPTYPFERKRHWVDAAPAQAAGPAAAAAPPGLDDWFFAPTWSRDDAPRAEPRLDGAWLVLAPPGPLGAAVARQLKAAGASPIVITAGDAYERVEASRFVVRAGAEEDLVAVVRALQSGGAAVRGAIHGWGADAVAPEGTPAALFYDSLVALAAALDATGGDARVLVATAGAQSVVGEPIDRPERVLVNGPVLALPAEVPGLRLRWVDVQPGAAEAVARDLVGEASSADREQVVAWRGGRRWVRRLDHVQIPSGEPPVRRGGAYLVTGGLGGIGLTLARWLVAHGAGRLLLTARTALPPREQWDAVLAASPHGRDAAAIRAIREVEAAGAEVVVAAADAADVDAMRTAVEGGLRRWGRLDGVVHAAGVSGNDRVAFRKTPDDVRAVFAPKVDGLSVLVHLLADTPLDFVALLGTISSIVAAPGLCDYAAANAALDAFPDSVQRPSAWRRVVTVSYAAWRDVGMAARRVASADRRGAAEEALRWAIDPARGADAFARVLASGRERVLVAPFDAAAALGAARHAAGRAPVPDPAEVPTPSAAGAQERPAVSTAFDAPAGDVEQRVAAIWSELLGIDRIGANDDFFELGGHSLLATRVLARVQQLLGARLALRDVFDAPTVRLLARRAMGARGDAGASGGEEREELEF